jgi:ATP adenylyltransferase
MLNGYPYNPGHLMVAPYRHMSSIEMMTEEERNEHYRLLSRGVVVLREVLNAENFNLGMNLGKTAGAGIDDHIHSHIVPRFQGDSNYMTVIGDVRVVPEALADSWKRLAGKF